MKSRPAGIGRRGFGALAVLAAVVFVVGGAAGQAADGKKEAKSETPRLAVLSPALAVIVRDLGLGAWIAGRHGYDAWSDQSLPVVGDQAGLDYEAMIGLKPTHVLMEWGTRPLPARLESLAKERGWSLENYSTLTLEDLRETTRRLSLLDPKQAAWAEHPLKLAMDRAWAKRDRDVAPAGRVLLMLGAQPMVSALGPGSAHQEILKLIGGQPAIEKGMPFVEMDAEDLLKLVPDAIVLIRPRAPGRAGDNKFEESERTYRVLKRDEIQSELGVLATLEIPAIKNGRVAVIDHPLALLPSTSLIRFADDLAGVLGMWSGTEAKKGE